MNLDADRDRLLEDDETLDFLLYQEMERKDNQPRQRGCLGVVLLLFLLPMGGLALLGVLR
ncbi:MAG: hypothetical protein RBT36_10915 [Desulfobulbus sp.]|jgi:hypothetical protein|nr:hypothetical protein [Desulfobulbus sp.]